MQQMILFCVAESEYMFILLIEISLSYLLIKLIAKCYSLQVQVTVLDKNDSPPKVLDTPLIYTVSEDLEIGHTIATIRATDPDPDIVSTVIFTLLNGHDSMFILEPTSGKLQLKDTLDRETKDVYNMRIRVNDGVQYTETDVIVQVSSSVQLGIIDYLCVLIIRNSLFCVFRWMIQMIIHRFSKKLFTHLTYQKMHHVAIKLAKYWPRMQTWLRMRKFHMLLFLIGPTTYSA